ncbi:MAG: pseudouridine synthase [Pseudomonadota bacterium]
MRIAKAIAHAGICSRRDAEALIGERRVKLNGRVLDAVGTVVGPTDVIVVDDAPLPAAEPPQLWRYYKPRGRVTTHRDPEGRPTVFDALPETLPRVISVGRLDFNTEGLLLLTTDGDLARHLELPSTGWLRRYRVRALGRITQARLDQLKDGTTIDGIRYGPVEAEIDRVQGSNTWMTIGLREGKNREVRKILGALELQVNRLIRVSYGPFQLLDMKPGDVEIVRRRVLIDQIGSDLAATLGLRETKDAQRAGRSSRPARKVDQTGPGRPITEPNDGSSQ